MQEILRRSSTMQRKEFVWRIQDSDSINSDQYLSEKFEVTKNDISSVWSLKLQRSSYYDKYQTTFAIYLELLQLNKLVIKVKCKLAVIKITKPPLKNDETFTEEWLWMYNDGSSNFRRFEILFNNCEVEKKLIDFVINCDITILEAGTFSNDVRFLVRDLSSLMNNEEFSDVVLISRDEQQFRAHKCVLAARSPVFAAMFKPGWEESRDGVVKIDDLDGEDLRRLLDYVYAGKFEDNENDDLEVVGSLLAAADKYTIEHLKMRCAEALGKRLSLDNIFDVHALADAHGVSGLKEQVVDFIVEHPEAIHSPKFLEAEKTNPLLINQILRRKWRQNE